MSQMGAEAAEKRRNTMDETADWLCDFAKGIHTRVCEDMRIKRIGRDEYAFFAYAPAPFAQKVELAGDFNAWGKTAMYRMTGSNVWTARVRSDVPLEGMCYKYRVYTQKECFLRPNFFAEYAQWGKQNASIVHLPEAFPWEDAVWLRQRGDMANSGRMETGAYPLNVYEVHLGSWRTRPGRSYGDADLYRNYRDIGGELAGYAAEMGYTHVEILSLTEKSMDKNFCFFHAAPFAPSARYGRPEELKAMVNQLHKAGIGVILDVDVGSLRVPGSTEGEKMSLMGSGILYWIREFHMDGIKLEILPSSLWRPGEKAREEREGQPCCFLRRDEIQRLCLAIKAEAPDVLLLAGVPFCNMAAGERVTVGGSRPSLGFDIAVNLHWTKRVMEYAQSDSDFKKYKIHCLNDALSKAFRERYLLSVSHEEVTGGKRALLEKMQGTYEEKFARLRLFYAYMMMHPGKKLTFMGCEIGETTEWDPQGQLAWFLIDHEAHGRLKQYVAELNRFYLNTPALWENDFSLRGLEWIAATSQERKIMIFRRVGKHGASVIVLINLEESPCENLILRLPGSCGCIRTVFNSDMARFSEAVCVSGERIFAESGDGKDEPGGEATEVRRFRLSVPALSVLVFQKDVLWEGVMALNEEKTESREKREKCGRENKKFCQNS